MLLPYGAAGIFGVPQCCRAPIAHHRFGRGRHVGAVLDQFLQHVGVALIGSLHQGGGTTFGFTGIHIGAVFQQCMYGIDVTRACGQHQRTATERQLFVGIGTALEQCLNHGGITACRGQPQRRGAIVIGQARFGAGLQQQFGQFCVAAISSPLQGGRAISLLCIHVGTVFQQTLDFRVVALTCGICNWRLRERSACHRR